MMGPDFMTDLIDVETSDHARLNLRLAYRWYFKVDREKADEVRKLFLVKDFVGDACKTLSSRIRGHVSQKTFDYFHKNSAQIIKGAVHKKDANGEFLPFHIQANNLFITQVDI
mmetsp:Transcript_33955/g.25040  ORF Transcript_33955/g.25040 Transcript_33955/m.25040 type:complete len:113 (-) Transcript_33955:677-1015(-)